MERVSSKRRGPALELTRETITRPTQSIDPVWFEEALWSTGKITAVCCAVAAATAAPVLVRAAQTRARASEEGLRTARRVIEVSPAPADPASSVD